MHFLFYLKAFHPDLPLVVFSFFSFFVSLQLQLCPGETPDVPSPSQRLQERVLPDGGVPREQVLALGIPVGSKEKPPRRTPEPELSVHPWDWVRVEVAEVSSQHVLEPSGSPGPRAPVMATHQDPQWVPMSAEAESQGVTGAHSERWAGRWSGMMVPQTWSRRPEGVRAAWRHGGLPSPALCALGFLPVVLLKNQVFPGACLSLRQMRSPDPGTHVHSETTVSIVRNDLFEPNTTKMGHREPQCSHPLQCQPC